MITINRGLVLLALVISVYALLAGDPAPAGQATRNELRQGRISAIQLADWLRMRRPGLRILDLRNQVDYDEFHLPQAQRHDTAQWNNLVPGDQPIVVMGPRATKIWWSLRQKGWTHAFYMNDGISEWMTDVINPTIARNATPLEMAVFRHNSEVSRYFGGLPRIVDESFAAPSSAEMLQAHRQGCGF